jgi:hypothetical protein
VCFVCVSCAVDEGSGGAFRIGGMQEPGCKVGISLTVPPRSNDRRRRAAEMCGFCQRNMIMMLLW